MERNMAYNVKSMIYYDDSGHIIEEWTGGKLKILDLQVTNEEFYLKAEFVSLFSPYVKDIKCIVDDKVYIMEQLTRDSEGILLQCKAKFANQTSEKNIQIVADSNCIEKKPKILFANKKKNERFKQKGFVYIGTQWLMKIKKKNIKLIANDSVKGKIKAVIVNIIM